VKQINNYFQVNVNSGVVIMEVLDTNLTKLPLRIHGAYKTSDWIKKKLHF